MGVSQELQPSTVRTGTCILAVKEVITTIHLPSVCALMPLCKRNFTRFPAHFPYRLVCADPPRQSSYMLGAAFLHAWCSACECNECLCLCFTKMCQEYRFAGTIFDVLTSAIHLVHCSKRKISWIFKYYERVNSSLRLPILEATLALVIKAS